MGVTGPGERPAWEVIGLELLDQNLIFLSFLYVSFLSVSYSYYPTSEGTPQWRWVSCGSVPGCMRSLLGSAKSKSMFRTRVCVRYWKKALEGCHSVTLLHPSKHLSMFLKTFLFSQFILNEAKHIGYAVHRQKGVCSSGHRQSLHRKPTQNAKMSSSKGHL